MKYSIKRQMMTVFVGLILFMIVVFMIVNGSFLEKYYISNKKSEFIKAYTMVQEGVENGTIDSETPEKDLGRFTEKNNISIAVIDSEYNVVYTNVREKQMMVVQLFGYLYDKNHQEVLEKTDSYDICKSVDPQNNTEYLTMWGNFDNGDIFIMRSPLESIRSAVMIFNRFIGVVGGCVILVSVLLAWYFSKRITEPIMELATLSQKMADLDFDAKYTSGGSNEIGVLGENFNRMSERLEQTISNLKEANYKLQKDIEQKEKRENMRSEFLGNVSHELKTPLTSIQGFAEMMAAGMVGKKEDVTRFGALIVKESKRLLELINSILFLTKIEGPETQDLAVAVSLKSITESVAGFMEPVIADKKIQLHLALTEDKVMGHSDMLREVVLNLVDNAVKYNRPGGHVYVTMEKAETGRNLLFTVEDTGIGIPKDKQDRVFERFYRVEESRSKRIGGTGLGLSIVKHIIEQHHGTIALTSREHFGTKIVVTLPLYQEDNPKE